MCLLMVVTLASCGNSDSSGTADKTREDYKPLTAVDVESFYDGSYELRSEAEKRYDETALKMFIDSVEKGDNEIFSPLSVYYCLAMLNNGSAGNTRKEIETYLNLSTEDANNFLKDLYDSTRSMNKWTQDVFLLANLICFDSERSKIKDSFLDDVQKYYGDVAKERDFRNSKEVADEINKWVDENTDGGIKDLVSDDDITKDTTSLIVNALACGGEWEFKFDKSKTFAEEFTAYDGSKINADMMHERLYGRWNTTKGKGFEKRLENGIEFVALIPNEGVDLYDFINELKPEDIVEMYKIYESEGNGRESDQKSPWGEPCYILDRYFTDLSFPKFSFEKEYDLEESLRKGGLSNLFDSKKCDFTNLTDSSFQVQKVKQKALVEVDEEHAYAAAATIIESGYGSDGPCIIYNDIIEELKFDRPFVFAFVENHTILFMGVVAQLEEGATQARTTFRIENYGAGKLNVRDRASTDGNVRRQIMKGDIVNAYSKVKSEGYTWYQIGDNEWVADKDGEWIRELHD